MLASWMLYCVAIGVLLSAGSAALERGLRSLGLIFAAMVSVPAGQAALNGELGSPWFVGVGLGSGGAVDLPPKRCAWSEPVAG